MRDLSRATWRALAWAIVAMVLVTTIAAAQVSSPGAEPSSPVSATDDASFPWPVLSPPSEVPLPPAIQPRGTPDASNTKHGVRVELWLSTPEAMPGEWVQAMVKTTNLRETPAWSMPSQCGRSGTSVTLDAREGMPPGVAQEANAAELKRKAVGRAGYGRAGFAKRKELLRWFPQDTSSVGGHGFVECMGLLEPRRLGPRTSTTERFAWYVASSFDEDKWFQPPWPGTATVSAWWPFIGRGDQPPGDNQDRWQRINRIRADAEVEIGGSGPGTPSIPELVDSALEHPRFRAWVDEDAARDSWWSVSWGSAAGPTYPHNLYSIGLEEAPPHGLRWLELDRIVGNAIHRGVATIDPWTGEVLRVHCMGPGSPSCPSATVLDEPSD